MFSECAKLDALSGLQLKLNEYRELNCGNRPIYKAKDAHKAGNSSILGNHLRTAGQARHGAHWGAHHIVCSRHASHGAARLKMFAYVGINDPLIGCWLPKKHEDAKGTVLPNAVGHGYLHTNKYAAWVGRTLPMANGEHDILNALQSIRRKVQNAKNEPDVVALLTEKGKIDLGVKIGEIR
ncbi:AHH domain-containing protein [Teredinibacter turnerae]|uniref:AHH domain-containing protein n=1 Tax=Teredinibacter turnerae TaxID=2426 RepID=UPI00036D3F32|nr:AHH domain-containing protein [Teredinibacter turnerae]